MLFLSLSGGWTGSRRVTIGACVARGISGLFRDRARPMIRASSPRDAIHHTRLDLFSTQTPRVETNIIRSFFRRTKTVIENAIQSCLSVSTLPLEGKAMARVIRAKARLANGSTISGMEGVYLYQDLLGARRRRFESVLDSV